MLSMWAGILFGGPVLFWLRAQKLFPEQERRLQEKANRPLERKIEDLDGELGAEQGRNYALRKQLQELEAEVERLKLRDQFLSKKEKDESGEKSILDSDEDFWLGSD